MDRQYIPNPPVVKLGNACADDYSGTGLLESLQLLGRHLPLGIEGKQHFRLAGKHNHRVAGLLVGAYECCNIRGLLHSRYLRNAAQMCTRQWLNLTYAAPDVQALCG